jgi:cytochrome P450
MSGPDHQHYRPIFRRALNPQLAQQLMPDFARIARQGLAIIRAESAENAGGIKPSGHLDRMLGNFWLRLFFAIEAESEQGALLQSLLPFIEFNNPTRASPAQIRSAVKALCALVERQVDSWQGSPPLCLLGAVLADNAADAKDPVVIGNLIYMLHTTSSDMSGLLCWLLKMMSDHALWLERLAQQPTPEDSAGTSSLATRIVMETLRMRQSEYISRAAISEIRFRGVVIPRGWLIRIGVWESHQNPAVFDNPGRFDPDRFLDRTYTRSEYMPFGLASHACLAPHMATLVGSTFLHELASGFHLTAPAGGALEFAPTRHWTPGAGYRVHLTSRQMTKLDASK